MFHGYSKLVLSSLLVLFLKRSCDKMFCCSVVKEWLFSEWKGECKWKCLVVHSFTFLLCFKWKFTIYVKFSWKSCWIYFCRISKTLQNSKNHHVLTSKTTFAFHVHTFIMIGGSYCVCQRSIAYSRRTYTPTLNSLSLFTLTQSVCGLHLHLAERDRRPDNMSVHIHGSSVYLNDYYCDN